MIEDESVDGDRSVDCVKAEMVLGVCFCKSTVVSRGADWS